VRRPAAAPVRAFNGGIRRGVAQNKPTLNNNAGSPLGEPVRRPAAAPVRAFNGGIRRGVAQNKPTLHNNAGSPLGEPVRRCLWWGFFMRNFSLRLRRFLLCLRFEKGISFFMLNFSFFIAIAPALVHAEETESLRPEALRLLAGYLENDMELQSLSIKLRQAEIGRERTGINNGFDLTLSSGTMILYAENGATAFSVEPEATLSFPALNSTKLSVSMPIAVETGEDLSMVNTSFALSTALLGSAGKQREVALLQADRTLLEAQRALTRRGLSAEREFYEILQLLYEGTVTALTYEEEAYTKEIELALAQKQGYSASSVYYRTKQLEAADKHRIAEEQRRTLERVMALFARDCGLASLSALPESLPPADLDDVPEFGLDVEKSHFTEIESARWNNYIGTLERNAAGNWELSAKLGITTNNSNLDSRTSADAGLILDWKGVSISAGSQFPLSGSDKDPAFTLSLGFNAGKQRTAALTDAEKSLAAAAETLALKSAERSWEETVEDMRSERRDLLWEKKRLTEQAELYRELAAETTTWYERGMVTDSDYRVALGNEERARFRLLALDVKNRIYLINSALYFSA
jgi:hypothetical protein